MSCALTVAPVLARTKTVTRRHVDSWKDLKVGDRLTLIEKGMGLPKGAKQRVLAPTVEVTAVTVEPLIGGSLAGDLTAEGFPDLTPAEFAFMWAEANGYKVDRYEQLRDINCRRIAIRYLDDEIAA